MLRLVLAGGPGAGKTTVLEDLGSRGHATVADSARSVISERRRSGQSPRPPPLEFANEIFRRDVAAYEARTPQASCIFYDRGVVDALGMLNRAAPLPSSQLEAYLAQYSYHRQVFVFPPWRAIYLNDSERDQSFAEAEAVHSSVTSWYRSCGYVLLEVPPAPVEERSAYVLRNLPGIGA